MSIHIAAGQGPDSRSILLPAIPCGQAIAEKFLDSPELFNEVRNMFGYTGTYKGKRVS
jgi:purine-nucleoside phosphorylase